MDRSTVKKISIISIVAILILLCVLMKTIINEKINSVEAFRDYMKAFGIFAPVVLTFFQALQVVIPIVPGYLGCAAGALAFGTATGFLCNYIGICVGSIIAYFLAKRFGIDIVLSLFSEKMYNKWSTRIEKSKSYSFFLFVATLLPLFPDDFLCYFSGLIKMNQKKFIWIILLGKPWCILVYSIAFGIIK